MVEAAPRRRPRGAPSRAAAVPRVWAPGLVALVLATAMTPCAEAGPARTVQNLKFGVRGVTFAEMKFSPSSPETLYVGSLQGFVYATHDGGISWEEGRLVTRRTQFFGSIRGSDAARGAGVDAGHVLQGAGSAGVARYRTSSLYDFPPATEDVFFDDDSPALWGAARLSALPDVHRLGIRDGGGGGGGGGDAARLGVGFKLAAPRLQGLLRKKRARLVGLNLQLLLRIRGVEPTGVWDMAVDPADPARAAVATDMGVFVTRDGGTGWLHVFAGSNISERHCYAMEWHPSRPGRVYLGTRGGFLISDDGGESWDRVTGTFLSSSQVNRIVLHSKDPDILLVGTPSGAFRSRDAGATWQWIFYETLPTQNYITSMAMDPDDPDRIFLGTRDGLFRSADGGATWQRSGALQFTATPIVQLLNDPRDGDHLVAGTQRDLWETFDGGETWETIYIHDSEWFIRSLRFQPGDPDVLWVLTSGELLRLAPPTRRAHQPHKGLFWPPPGEPSLDRVLDATLRRYDVHIGQRGALRDRARAAAWLPRVSLFGGFLQIGGDAGFNAFLSTLEQGRVGVTEPVILRDAAVAIPYAGLQLSWDFRSTVLHEEEPPFGRMFSVANSAYLNLKYEVQRLYEERRRLLVRLHLEPPTGRELLLLRLRLEELTAHLDAHTGGLYAAVINRFDALSQIPD